MATITTCPHPFHYHADVLPVELFRAFENRDAATLQRAIFELHAQLTPETLDVIGPKLHTALALYDALALGGIVVTMMTDTINI